MSRFSFRFSLVAAVVVLAGAPKRAPAAIAPYAGDAQAALTNGMRLLRRALHLGQDEVVSHAISLSSREAALGHFGFDAALPLVYVTGGAQGSHRINRVVGEALPRLLAICQILHQCGDNAETGDHAWLQDRARALPPRIRPRYAVRPYVGAELRDVYAAAALLVGRSGAGTVTECCNLGVPAVFIPLPGAGGNEQAANAGLVEAAGGAVVLPQGDLTAERLVDTLTCLLADRAGLQTMGARARALAVPDAARRLALLIREVAAP